MTWSDVTRAPSHRVVRQFAALCFLLLGLLGILQAARHGRPVLGAALILVGATCLLAGWWAPSVFRWVFTAAMLLAFPIGFVVAQVILALLFLLVFTPLGLLLRLRGRDAMMRARKPAGATYWEDRPPAPEAARYLRQY